MFFGVNDPLCGMKGYQSEFYKKYGFFDQSKMIGTELLAYAIRDKQLIKQVPIEVKKREDKSRYGGVLSSYINILRVMCLFFVISFSKKEK